MSHRPCVLVIEDEPVVAQTTRAILENNGYAVLGTESATEAINLVRANQVAVALLDLSVGRSVTPPLPITLKTISPALKIILYSGSIETDEHIPGIDATLPKPSSVHDLLSTLANLQS
jgi:CheY-like chemotaxis protein